MDPAETPHNHPYIKYKKDLEIHSCIDKNLGDRMYDNQGSDETLTHKSQSSTTISQCSRIKFGSNLDY